MILNVFDLILKRIPKTKIVTTTFFGELGGSMEVG